MSIPDNRLAEIEAIHVEFDNLIGTPTKARQLIYAVPELVAALREAQTELDVLRIQLVTAQDATVKFAHERDAARADLAALRTAVKDLADVIEDPNTAFTFPVKDMGQVLRALLAGTDHLFEIQGEMK